MKKKTIIVIIGLLLISLISKAISVNLPNIEKTSYGYRLRITINFVSQPSNFKIYPAKLRYNKDFAYSLTLDDGLEDAYQYAYFLLNGGYCNANQTFYPGLKYSDGCGNVIKFKAGISWYSINRDGLDIHTGLHNFVTWDQLEILYENGWDVFNHGYSSVYNQANINYNYEINQNNIVVKTKTGIDLSHFVVPSNDDNYFSPAFSNGMKAIYGAFDEFQGFEEDLNVSEALDLDNFRLFRKLVHDGGVNSNNIMNYINNAYARSSDGNNNIWCNEFTHSVGESSNGASLLFPMFEFYMQEIERQYGILGRDNIWMAPLQEVYEYLAIRDNVRIEWLSSGNQIMVYIDFSSVPEDLRKNALSLIIESDTEFNDLSFSRQVNTTFLGSGNNKLINIDWEKGVFNNIDDMEYKSSDKNHNLFNIFPNPVDNLLNIKIKDKLRYETVYFSFINNQGEKVFESTKEDKDDNRLFKINLPADLPKGLYYISLRTDNRNMGSARIILK